MDFEEFRNCIISKLEGLGNAFGSRHDEELLKFGQLEEKFKTLKANTEKSMFELVVRLKTAETAEQAAKQRIVDIEKQSQAEVRTMSTLLENALASRKAGERQLVEMEQAHELETHESGRQLASAKTSLSVAICEGKLRSNQLEASLEARKIAENEALTKLADCQGQLEASQQSEEQLKLQIIELEAQVKALLDQQPKSFPDPEQQAGLLLLNAARRGDVEVIQAVLQQNYRGVNMIESQDEDGCRPLLLAAKYGHYEAVKILADFRAELEARNYKGYTALIAAADRGHLEVVRLLLDSGANINAQNSKTGLTAIMCATYRGNTAMVSLLLRRNAAITACVVQSQSPDNNITPCLNATNGMTNSSAVTTISVLDVARKHGRGEIVQLLRNRGIRS